MATHRRYHKIRATQRGLTLLGLIGIFSVFGVFLLIGIKLFPIYFESYEVGKTLESLKSDMKINPRSAPELLSTLLKRLSINDVRHVGRDQIVINYAENKAVVRVRYEVRFPFVGNLDLIADFDKQVELSL
ncbi:MAG: DUF4845 domain-containing protein [Gammaproteobacteria bacterium]|nr:DUF4845 domain-containing protein [Gammaproteobacteria bacterium]